MNPKNRPKNVKPDAEIVAALQLLSEKLGVKNAQDIAIATPGKSAVARMYDGSLEARVFPFNSHAVRITSPRAPGVYIQLVDQSDVLAPAEAIYKITAFIPDQAPATDGQYLDTSLNGDLYSVYVGRKGIILDKIQRERAAKLPKITD